MEALAVVKKKHWQLTAEALDLLLSTLDSNRDQAGVKYEAMRRRLVRFFDFRGSTTPEVHADEAINRLARKLTEGEVILNPENFVGGVARRLVFEMLEERERERKALVALPAPVVPSPDMIEDDEDDARLHHFRACLLKLPDEQRKLIVDYYREDEGSRISQRKAMAKRLGLSETALRIRAHRIRQMLEGYLKGSAQSHGQVETLS